MDTMLPEVSVFWLNYNSMHVIDIIKKSLDAIFQLDYPNFEFVVVDNGSTDGSKEIIKDYVKAKAVDKSKVKFVELNRNWGFAGGINAAYRARDRRSEYVAIINNDAIPKPDYLRRLVMFLEEHKNVGAVQGIIVKLGENHTVDSAGGFVDEGLNVFSSFNEKPANILLKPMYVSYVEGTMPVYRVEAIRHVLGDDTTMYVSSGFMYYLEDVFLSLMLWNHGYKCVSLPLITGEHYRMATIKKFYKSINLPYYSSRNRMALLYMTNSREKKRIILKYLSRIALTKGGLAKRKMISKALIDGVRLGRELREKYGIIDIYKAPLLKMSFKERLFI